MRAFLIVVLLAILAVAFSPRADAGYCANGRCPAVSLDAPKLAVVPTVVTARPEVALRTPVRAILRGTTQRLVGVLRLWESRVQEVRARRAARRN